MRESRQERKSLLCKRRKRKRLNSLKDVVAVAVVAEAVALTTVTMMMVATTSAVELAVVRENLERTPTARRANLRVMTMTVFTRHQCVPNKRRTLSRLNRTCS